jgi:hypothetical protein
MLSLATVCLYTASATVSRSSMIRDLLNSVRAHSALCGSKPLKSKWEIENRLWAHPLENLEADLPMLTVDIMEFNSTSVLTLLEEFLLNLTPLENPIYRVAPVPTDRFEELLPHTYWLRILRDALFARSGPPRLLPTGIVEHVSAELVSRIAQPLLHVLKSDDGRRDITADVARIHSESSAYIRHLIKGKAYARLAISIGLQRTYATVLNQLKGNRERVASDTLIPVRFPVVPLSNNELLNASTNWLLEFRNELMHKYANGIRVSVSRSLLLNLTSDFFAKAGTPILTALGTDDLEHIAKVSSETEEKFVDHVRYLLRARVYDPTLITSAVFCTHAALVQRL